MHETTLAAKRTITPKPGPPAIPNASIEPKAQTIGGVDVTSPSGCWPVLFWNNQLRRPSAWLGRNRRLAKDFERLIDTTTAMAYLAMIQLLIRRLASP